MDFEGLQPKLTFMELGEPVKNLKITYFLFFLF